MMAGLNQVKGRKGSIDVFFFSRDIVHFSLGRKEEKKKERRRKEGRERGRKGWSKKKEEREEGKREREI
jgi:hypothetical protein